QEQRRNRSNCRPRRVDESLAAESQTPRPICHSPAIVAERRAQRCRRGPPRSCIAVGCVGMGLRPVPAEYRSAAKLLLAAFSARNEVVPSQSGAQKQKPRYHARCFRKSYCLNYWSSLPSYSSGHCPSIQGSRNEKSSQELMNSSTDVWRD